jgi:hypothetical protein
MNIGLKTLIFFMTFLNKVNSISSQIIKETHKVTKFVHEAELKHGRVALVSTITIPIIEIQNGNHQGNNREIYELSSQKVSFQTTLFGVFDCSEVEQLLKKYGYPSNPTKLFTMKDEHIPGDYSFDPFAFLNKTDSFEKQEELFNSRFTLLSTFNILVQELCTDKPVIDTLIARM